MKKFLLLSLFALCASQGAYAQQPQAAAADKFEPPMIPHPIAAYIPITPTKNACLMCHRPAQPGQQVAKGMPTPLPASHVSDGKVNPNRYECLLCHAEVLPKK